MRRMRKKLSIMLMFTSNDFFSTVAAIVAIDTYHIENNFCYSQPVGAHRRAMWRDT
jgi:hypothetical protein